MMLSVLPPAALDWGGGGGGNERELTKLTPRGSQQQTVNKQFEQLPLPAIKLNFDRVVNKTWPELICPKHSWRLPHKSLAK